MKTTTIITSLALTAITSLSLVACGDDSGGDDDSCPTADAASCPGPVDPVYVQVEHLGRPGIAEALLLSNGFLAGYNATAPTFIGVPQATLDQVVGEAKVVLKAIYLGVCFTNGAAGLPVDQQFKPAGQTCVEVGGALLDGNGQLKATVLAGAQAYADLVFGQFEPDVLRIDTQVASGYFIGAPGFCAAGAADKPLLCSGRLLTDDVIDITYNYLLSGTVSGPTDVVQKTAIISDGVSYAGAANNPAQGHPATSGTFPYSAPPI